MCPKNLSLPWEDSHLWMFNVSLGLWRRNKTARMRASPSTSFLPWIRNIVHSANDSIKLFKFLGMVRWNIWAENGMSFAQHRFVQCCQVYTDPYTLSQFWDRDIARAPLCGNGDRRNDALSKHGVDFVLRFDSNGWGRPLKADEILQFWRLAPGQQRLSCLGRGRADLSKHIVSDIWRSSCVRVAPKVPTTDRVVPPGPPKIYWDFVSCYSLGQVFLSLNCVSWHGYPPPQWRFRILLRWCRLHQERNLDLFKIGYFVDGQMPCCLFFGIQ